MVGITLAQFSSKNFSTLFSENIDSSLASKVTNKIFMTISMGVTGKKSNSGAIIPLSVDKIVSYAVIFKNPNEEEDLYSLSFTVDADNQLVLYKRIPILETLTKEFIVQVEENIFAVNDPIKLKEMLANVIETSNDLFLMESLADEKDSTSPLLNLINKFGKNIHIFYRSILLNEKTVIVTDSRENSNIMNLPWNQLAPHKTLKIIPWPKDPSKENDFDILIIEKFQKKDCTLDCVKMDWEIGQVEHGKSDKYLENLFAYLKDLNHGMALELNLEVNNIFSWVHEIIEVCTKNKTADFDAEIKKLIEFHTKTRFGNRLPLLTSIARKYNEFASDRIVTYFLKELGIFEKDVKRIDSKKLLSKL